MAWFTLEDIYNDIQNGASLPRLHKVYGGAELYIPQQMPDYKERIIEEFSGYNYDELSHKYNTTVRNVRKIVEEVKPKAPTLF